MADPPRVVHMLDYGAGNVRSIRNAIEAVGWQIVDVVKPEQLADATALVFPGVGAFGSAMAFLNERGFVQPLKDYISAGRPYFGICLGMQTLFESSEESPGVAGLGIIPGAVTRFESSADYSVPHIGWNGVRLHQAAPALGDLYGSKDDGSEDGKVYFVHSYRAEPTAANACWIAATTDYGKGPFVSAIQKGRVFATQFHPEKSGEAGLRIFRAFLEFAWASSEGRSTASSPSSSSSSGVAAGPTLSRGLEPVPVPGGPLPSRRTRLARRIIACLDVRENDQGDLVVTKGDQYDVREKSSSSDVSDPAGRPVRNLGKPVDLCARYYAEGADEVALLNITAFRGEPLEDAPLLAVLEKASARVFVPLTIGGGIRGYTDGAGRSWSALDVAATYFRAGADKVSIGSDAVTAAEAFYARGGVLDGSTAIEQIAHVYGRQAVVVSLDPRRVYVSGPDAPDVVAAGHHVIPTARPGPNGEAWCWYQCLVKGGREGRPLDAWKLARAVEALGAGELLVNCVDQDGQKGGYDEELLADICAGVRIPVIASSGAGCPAHFTSVFAHTRCEAALAAGIFHRREVAIADVKAHMTHAGVEARV